MEIPEDVLAGWSPADYGTIAIAVLALASFLLSSLFYRWTKDLRFPNPNLVEAWIKKEQGDSFWYLLLGLSNCGDAPIAIRQIIARVPLGEDVYVGPIKPHESNYILTQLEVDEGLLKPHELTRMKIPIIVLTREATQQLSQQAMLIALEYVSGSRLRVLAWTISRSKWGEMHTKHWLLPFIAPLGVRWWNRKNKRWVTFTAIPPCERKNDAR